MCCQILLKNSDLGTTVDEVERLIKRHEAFEKLLSTQEDKVGLTLVLQLHLVDALIQSDLLKVQGHSPRGK